MDSKKLLKELNSFTSSNTIHMYIIERKLKQDAKPKDKASQKYDYFPLQVNITTELNAVISGMLENVIKKKVKEGVAIMEYEPIDDTTDKLCTYNDLSKIAGFQEFLSTKLGEEIKSIKNFEEFKEIEKAWALCYGFYNKDSKKWLYCIKKLAPRNMAIEINTSENILGAFKHGIVSMFDLETKTLKPFKGFSLNIEPSIDIVYYKEKIYIFQKKAFEELTSLTEEFESLANEIVSELKELTFITDTSHISSIIVSKPAFRTKLIKAKSIGNIDFLTTCKDIKKEFTRAGKKLDIKFKFDNEGKIIADDENDAENIIKVLSEYYKEGIFGGKIFESPAGRVKK